MSCRCRQNGEDQRDCRYHIDYPEDDNCCFVAIEKHGNMGLKEIAERLHYSCGRIKQIEDEALDKLNKLIDDD
jgi:hypothetical protein